MLSSGRVSVFLTHGGYSSLIEGRSARVPFVVLPVIPGDQPFNADFVENQGFGVAASTMDSADALAEKLVNVARNASFHVAAMDAAVEVERLRLGSATMEVCVKVDIFFFVVPPFNRSC